MKSQEYRPILKRNIQAPTKVAGLMYSESQVSAGIRRTGALRVDPTGRESGCSIINVLYRSDVT